MNRLKIFIGLWMVSYYCFGQFPSKIVLFTPYYVNNDAFFYDSIRKWRVLCESKICQFDDGVVTGKVLIYNYETNKLYGDAEYYLGYKNGEANIYDKRGKKIKRAHFNYDTLDGNFIYYNWRDKPYRIETYVKGKIRGKIIELKGNGDTLSVENFVEFPIKDGQQIYFRNGKRKRVIYYKMGRRSKEENKNISSEQAHDFNRGRNGRKDDSNIDVVSMIRYLEKDNANLFRATDAELYEMLPKDLPKIKIIDEWCQEDNFIFQESDSKKPSESQLLAV